MRGRLQRNGKDAPVFHTAGKHYTRCDTLSKSKPLQFTSLQHPYAEYTENSTHETTNRQSLESQMNTTEHGTGEQRGKAPLDPETNNVRTVRAG